MASKEITEEESKQITEEDVYLCTGNPLPKDIEQISHWLLNKPFDECYKGTISFSETYKSIER